MEVNKNIRTYSEPLSKDIFDDLVFIFKRYNSAKTYFSNRYGSINSFGLLKTYKKDIRDVLTSDGSLDKFNMPKRYVRMALDDSIGAIKTRWINCIKKINLFINSKDDLNKDEKHYIRYILKSDKYFNLVLLKQEFELPTILNQYTNLDTVKLNKLIHRLVRKYLPKKSKYKYTNSIMVDSQMYNYEIGSTEFKLSSTILNKRHKLIITPIKLNGNLQLKLDVKKRILRISNCIKIKSIETTNTEVIGIDKNYINAIDTSNKTSYGCDLNEILNEFTDVFSAKHKKRNYYYGLIKKYKEIGDKKSLKKIENIRKFNLGKVKHNKLKNKYDSEVDKLINRGIKDFIINDKPKVIVVEDLSFVVKNKGKRNKKTNNKLSGFVKGKIQERIEYISDLNGITTEKVNAAYTSQICSCGHFGVRKDNIFHCQCGKVGYSGHVAAEEILRRRDDKEITLSSSPKQVKSILEKRLLDKDNQAMLDLTNRTNQDLHK